MVEQAYYQKPGHVVAAAVVLPVLDTVTVILRLYARRRQRLPLQADDWLTIPATVGFFPPGIGFPILTVMTTAIDIGPRRCSRHW